ncbi:MAG: N-acetylmuramoyl-L-alanine amidase [Clostridiales bacterium]|jgi:N-acetylmuramoyl-L-alanine amidase|nr:N-acetylmuramoyl-L-alanine amidase [Eubacteriales bacterium]MDH7567800.1 N-acetylmuramoyl-L-alanine amidase [Clostridiales bacterium]
MKNILIFISVFLYAIASTSFSGPQLIYASKGSPGISQKSGKNYALNDSGAKRPRDFKLPDETVDENTIYNISSIVTGPNTKESMPKKRVLSWKKSHLVVIDPGHGGNDPGARAYGLVEKEINLDVALRVNSLLKDYGVRTYMTRTDDCFVGPKDRIYTANQKKASLFLCIHSNWFKDPSFNGTMTLYYPSRDLSQGNLSELNYALTIQNQLSNTLATKDRGIIDRPNLSVLKHAQMPSVLVELGFMSNKEDARLLASDEFRQKAAQALARGVIEALAEID